MSPAENFHPIERSERRTLIARICNLFKLVEGVGFEPT